jgi:hypothetical protein
VFCRVPLDGEGFVTLALAYTAEFLQADGLRSGDFLPLEISEIGFSGQAFVMAVQDSTVPATREGELLVAMERRHEGDFGIMVFGKGPLAQEIMECRRERSREIVLVMEKPDGGRVDITLICFTEWLESNVARIGKYLFLDLADMGVRGWARVIEINPCPPLELPGTGPHRSQLVTGTFRHSSGEVYDLKLQSEPKVIGVTGSHPFWSMDRDDWVSANDLRIGETLKRWEGATIVERIAKRPEPGTVYNIEVEGDHVYRVGESGLLVHNASASCNLFPEKHFGVDFNTHNINLPITVAGVRLEGVEARIDSVVNTPMPKLAYPDCWLASWNQGLQRVKSKVDR